MLRNYIKVSYRNLLRQKTYTLINIIGLSVGIAFSILIGVYVKHEYSYDKFNKDAERIYRVVLDFRIGTNAMRGPVSPAPMAAKILNTLPDVESAVRICQDGNKSIRAGEKTYYEDRFFYVDSNFFELFNVHFLYGNPSSALNRPFSLVITRELSVKYFGTDNAVGKTLRILNRDSALYEVTGVVEPFPDNSHFGFDILSSMSAYPQSKSTLWLANSFYTYLKLRKGTDEKVFTDQLTELFKNNASPQLLQYFKINRNDFINNGNRYSYGIQKLTDIHLKSNMNFELAPNGSTTYVSIFILIAVFILLNACINFTNLATARSSIRVKEVGLRKLMGSDRKSLIFQFLIESILVSYTAVILGMLLVELLMPQFNLLLNVNLHLYWSEYLKLLPSILLLATIVGVLSGAYPAFYLSSFKPDEILKNKFFHGAARNWLRNSLVVFQFTISIIILLATMLVANQLRYIQNEKPGFDKERLLVIEHTNPVRKQMNTFLKDLRKCKYIEGVALSSEIPGRVVSDQGFVLEDKKSTETYVINTCTGNPDYLKTMGMVLLQGRFFSDHKQADTLSLVINEAGVRYLSLKNPIGRQLIVPGNSIQNRKIYTIVGVVKDFQYESLHKPVHPLVIFMSENYSEGFVNIRFTEGKEKDVLEYVNLTWKNIVPASPLQYFYYSDQFKDMYKKEIETKHLLNVFSIVAIFVASLGLFGLIAFMAERRTKEIGVRKVLGSSIWSVVRLMTSEITFLVLLSYIIAAPLAYWWMKYWLSQFAYKTPVEFWIFLIAGAISIGIAWLTVGFLAIKTGSKNPIYSLRYE